MYRSAAWVFKVGYAPIKFALLSKYIIGRDAVTLIAALYQ